MPLNMDQFVVSARKYRPVTFDTVVGQPSITTTLKNAIRNNHLAQAFLFTGPRGVGKTTTARILAKTINCVNISAETEACNTCDSCTSFNSGQSLNIYELDAASNNSVDDIRALVEQVRYAPQMGKYKVYIIDEVHMLSASAFNAFLKTLEEPPSYAIFILATTEKHKIIPTILSRCQIFDFNRISVEDIAAHLKVIAGREAVDAEEDALHIIAQKADGALRDALSLFDQLVTFAGNTLSYKQVIENLNILDYDYYFRLTDELLSANISASLLTFNEILNNGFDGHNFINGIGAHFRDLLVCKDPITLSLLEVSAGIREKYKVQAHSCGMSWLLQGLDITNKADVGYKSARNQRLHVELALMKLCQLSDTVAASPPPDKKKVESKSAVNPVTDAAPKTAAASGTSVPHSSVPKTTPVSNPKVAAATPAPAVPAVTATAPVSEVSKPAGTTSRKTISLSTSLKNTGESPEVKKKNPETLPDTANAFSPEEFEQAWKAYAEHLSKLGRMTLNAALLKRKPELKDDCSINLIVDNGATQKDLEEQKSDMMGFLRKRLSNYKINLLITVSDSNTVDSIPYTPSEKFKKLAEKNPLLYEMKKKFDLEIDY